MIRTIYLMMMMMMVMMIIIIIITVQTVKQMIDIDGSRPKIAEAWPPALPGQCWEASERRLTGKIVSLA